MPETLTTEEFKALKQIGDARAKSSIPTKIRDRLIEIGYAKDRAAPITARNLRTHQRAS
jgi:hypothetical protein